MCAQTLPSAQATSSVLRIAVVDDDLEVLISLRFLLETEGFNVCTFRSGRSLLSLESSFFIDCYVIDYKMEPMSGLDLACHLRKRDPAATIIMVTGVPSETIQIEAHRLGVYSVLAKPHLEEALGPAILAAIAQKPHSDPI